MDSYRLFTWTNFFTYLKASSLLFLLFAGAYFIINHAVPNGSCEEAYRKLNLISKFQLYQVKKI
jgi:hypothetical protein